MKNHCADDKNKKITIILDATHAYKNYAHNYAARLNINEQLTLRACVRDPRIRRKA